MKKSNALWNNAKKVCKMAKNHIHKRDELLEEELISFKTKKNLCNNDVIYIFSLLFEAVRRVKNIELHLEQVYGGLIVSNGSIAEIKTGEGKTFVLLFPALINFVKGKKVHIATTNEYLAQRDWEILKPILSILGVSSGCILSDMDKETKKEIYQKDILFSTLTNYGFDYLRDHLVYDVQDKIQNHLEVLLLDEIDFLALDEAETPMIISEQIPTNKSLIQLAGDAAKLLKKGDIEKDEIKKQIWLTPAGEKKIEEFLGIESIYEKEHAEILNNIMLFLEANHFQRKGKEYIVKNEKIQLVDLYTGRVMPNKQFGNGLHQILQVKENVPVSNKTVIKAMISTFNFIKMYNFLAGVSGTAYVDKDIFEKMYGKKVYKVPAHKKSLRFEHKDSFFKTKDEKYKNIVDFASAKFSNNQSVLIGTSNIVEAKRLEKFFQKKKVDCKLLTAENDDNEKELIEKLGKEPGIIISTNMIGRGTDVKISNEMEQRGGLVVIGAEKNVIERVNEQLKGRAGRQGKIGECKFFISLEDEIFEQVEHKNHKEKIKKMIEDINNKKIDRQAKRILNFTRKMLNQERVINRDIIVLYENEVEKKRKEVYQLRNLILLENTTKFFTAKMIRKWVEMLNRKNPDYLGVLLNKFKLEDDDWKTVNQSLISLYEKVRNEIGEQIFDDYEKHLFLYYLDENWSKFLEKYLELKQNLQIRVYGYEDLFLHFKDEIDQLYKNFMDDILDQYFESIFANHLPKGK